LTEELSLRLSALCSRRLSRLFSRRCCKAMLSIAPLEPPCPATARAASAGMAVLHCGTKRMRAARALRTAVAAHAAALKISRLPNTTQFQKHSTPPPAAAAGQTCFTPPIKGARSTSRSTALPRAVIQCLADAALGTCCSPQQPPRGEGGPAGASRRCPSISARGSAACCGADQPAQEAPPAQSRAP